MIVSYPEALNQHPGDAIDVLRTFLFSIPFGLFAFMVALLILFVGTLLKSRRTTLEREALQVLIRAALPIGIAVTLFTPILVSSEIAGKGFAFAMAFVTLVAVVTLAWFNLRRSREARVNRLFPDSWWVLSLTVPLLIGIATSIFSARINAGIASRQAETVGVILDCQPSNLCRFTFEFLGRSFEGAGKLATGTATVGQPVTVFLDSNHPQTNSLEDFARTSRRQIVMVPFCLIAIVAIVGASIYAGRMKSSAA